MKLLQVANVATVLGGTGACAYSITRCLPDWEHAVFFMSGQVTQELRDMFNCQLIQESRLLPATIDAVKPDVIIWHNTDSHRMPQYIPSYCLNFYYQHSAARACIEARNRCTYFWPCSKWLGEQVNLVDTFYQPCPIPAVPEDKRYLRESQHLVVVGRLCTPNARKWKDSISLYDHLSGQHEQVWWEFVGTPEPIVEELKQACRGRASFVEPSWRARSLLHKWHFLLYDSTLQESYGRVVCEAQRCGCVPIVSRRGGFLEQIEHGKSGFLCETPDDFSQALYNGQQSFSKLSEQAKLSGDGRGGLEQWRTVFLTWVRAAVTS